MLLADYMLPGIIMLLKFAMRMSTDSETNAADTARALIVFPIDIAFLALSYGSAVLYSAPPNDINQNTMKIIIIIILIAIFLLFPVTLLAKKAERSFVLEKQWKCLSLVTLAYILAFSVASLSISVGRFF